MMGTGKDRFIWIMTGVLDKTKVANKMSRKKKTHFLKYLQFEKKESFQLFRFFHNI